MSGPYTFEGTPQPSRNILSAVIAGDIPLLKQLLKILPETESFGWLWEPYATLQRPTQLEAITIVMDDPRFRFDARFVAGCCYFTPPLLRKRVLSHPRAKKWIMKPSYFEVDYIHECLDVMKLMRMDMGLMARMNEAKSEIYKANDLYRKSQRERLVFFLYPFLKSWIACFLAEYYGPGGKGYLKAKERFEAAIAV